MCAFRDGKEIRQNLARFTLKAFKKLVKQSLVKQYQKVLIAVKHYYQYI